MFKTRITEMLGIEYPIIQGGMLWLSTAELLTVISGQVGLKALQEGDSDLGIIACGQVVGLIDDLKSVQDVIQEMVDGAHTIYQCFGTLGIGAKGS